MGAIFEPKQISLARYGREVVPYTWGPASLPAGNTTIFDISDWNAGDATDKIIALVSLAATQNAGVQLVWSYDGQQSNAGQGWTDAMPAGLRPVSVNAWAANRLALTVNNTTGNPIANTQLNYAVLVWALPVSWEQMLGYQSSQEDNDLLASLPNENGQTAAAAIAALIQKGTLPVSWIRTLEALFLNRQLADPGDAVPRHVTTASSLVPASFNVRIPAGTVGVLEAIGFEAQPAGVVLAIDRDTDLSYVQVNAAAIARADDLPMDGWVPATDHFTFNVSGAVGTFALYPRVRLYKLSDLLRVHLRIATKPAATNAKVKAGFQ